MACGEAREQKDYKRLANMGHSVAHGVGGIYVGNDGVLLLG